jgi:hypothetical protein
MYRTAALLTLVVTVAASSPVGAIDLGLGLFKRKSKPEPVSRVKSLVAVLRTDPDARHRQSAATALRDFDPRTNPDVIPALIGSLQRDPSSAVRSEVAESIGKLKPVYQPAGIAMETALQSDPDAKVREAIKSALWQYHLNGYRTPPVGSPIAAQTAEPPLAALRAMPTNSVAPPPRHVPLVSGEPTFRPITNTIGKGVFYQPTAEPPLAQPKTPVAPPTTNILPPPLPAKSVPDPATKPAPNPPSVSVPGVSIPTVSIPPGPSVPTPPPSEKPTF